MLSIVYLKEFAESEKVVELESKLKKWHNKNRYKSYQDDLFSEPEHFTSVTLIHQKSCKTIKEIITFAYLHGTGDFTESGVYSSISSFSNAEVSKVTTDIADILSSMEGTDHPYTLLIEGAPGIGKTILAKEIVFQWANGKLLKKEKLVFFIYLRDSKTKLINSFESLISYISYSQISKSIEQYVSGNSGKGVTLVFDGYDEYPKELRNDSYLSDVIKHRKLELQSCKIIVTSRSSASACLHNSKIFHIEILGFTKNHRKLYIFQALKDNPDAAQDLLEYLESNCSLDAYCHIPLSMAILVSLFKEYDYDKSKLPATQTELNYKFICITIRRFIKKSHQQSLSISKFSEVPESYKQILFEVSELAFKALQEDNIVFTAKEIGDFCPSLLREQNDCNGLGLLETVQYFSLDKNSDELSFNFLHFTVQELLAAYHISLMSETQQTKQLEDTFWNSRYYNVWIMYVALNKDQLSTFMQFITDRRPPKVFRSGSSQASISKNIKENKIWCLHLFQCFTEAGNDDMCHHVSELLQNGTIDLSRQTLSAVEMYTLSSFLARCVHRSWNLLDLSNCKIDDENFERFYKSYDSLTKSKVRVNTIDFSSNKLTQLSAFKIADLVLNFDTKLCIFASNEIKDIGIDQAIFAGLIEHLGTGLIKIQDKNQVLLIYKKTLSNSTASELIIMCYCMTKTYEDTQLYIENNNPFFEALLNTSNLSTMITFIHKVISKMTFLSTNFKFHLKNINFTTQEMNSIISNLTYDFPLAVRIGESCLPLKFSYMSNDITEENEIFRISGTIFFCGSYSRSLIFSIFCHFLTKYNLTEIYLNGIVLYDYYINDSFLVTNCTVLKLINCCMHNNVKPTVAVDVLSQVINKTTSLEHLNLSGCRFKNEHTMIISKTLTQATSIKTMVISENNLSNEVVDVLASVITCNMALQNIELSNCNLQEAGIVIISKALINIKCLGLLDLSNNIITSEAAINIAAVIKECHSIKDLRLHNCNLQNTGLQVIATALAKKCSFNCIDISHNVISDKNAMLLASVIENNKTLQKINFSNCRLQDKGCQLIFDSIAKVSNLLFLNFNANFFHKAVDNFTIMVQHNTQLEHLSVSECCNAAKSSEIITKELIILKSLHYLDFSNNIINATSANNIADIISNNTNLEYLNLSNCNGASLSFTITMQNNRYLKYLNLSSSSIGHQETDNIGNVISISPYLEYIDLNNCSLSEKGMKNILLPLRNHELLKHFDISSNTITDNVVNEIADVIDSNTQLTHLNISDTGITEYGILKIFKAAKRIKTLKSIKMCNCTITNRAALAIADAISVNCMIEELVFTNNDFHEAGIKLLFDVLMQTNMLKCLTIASDSNNIIATKVTKVVSNNCITHFILSNCNLEQVSFSTILNTLILQAPHLQHIDLSGNNLNDTAETMAQLISVSYYLQHVNLANTLMQDEEVMIIVKAMQNINSLRYVDLTSYSINDELALELQNTIKSNLAVISVKVSKLNLRTTIGNKIFGVLVNLQHISICFSDYESIVDTAVTLIKNSPLLQYLHLESDTLMEMNISNIIEALEKTTSLQYFCLLNFVIDHKVEEEIADVIENNTHLTHFRLEGCKLIENGLTKCIRSFNMTRLSHLFLVNINGLINNTTRQLNRTICNSVIHLDLSNSSLDIIKLSYLCLSFLTKLRYLNLSHNPFTDEGADILSSIIVKNNSLKHLDLRDCKLQSEGIRIVSNSLTSINIVYLDLSFNHIDVEVFNNNVMPVFLSSLKEIEHLYLPYCEMQQREIDKLNQFMSKVEHLKYIDIGFNYLSKSTIDHFTNVIFVTSGNKHVRIDTQGTKKINLKLLESLCYLNMNNVMVDNQVEDLMIALIKNSPNLEHLEIAKCSLTFTSALECFRALRNRKTLLHLNLADNTFTVAQISSLLNGCTALKSLQLHKCGLEDDEIISSSVQRIKLFTLAELKCLDLSCISINDVAVNYLAILIANNVGLEYLNLSNCSLESSGIVAITKVLKMVQVSSLKHVDITLNTVENDLITDLITLLVRNKSLEHLRISKLVLDNVMFNNIKCHLSIIKGLESLSINGCWFSDKDINMVVSVLANNLILRELHLLECKMSTRSKIAMMNHIQLASMQSMLQLNINIIISDTDLRQKFTKYPLKFVLKNTDVVAISALTNNDSNLRLRELMLLKLVLKQSGLEQLRINNVAIRQVEVFHIEDCTFTDDDAYYVASLIYKNATTIQSFSMIACKMSFQGKKMIHRATCKLDIFLLHNLNISNNSFGDKVQGKPTRSELEWSGINVVECRLTDNIVAAVMTDENNLKMSKCIIDQSALQGLCKTLKLITGIIYLKITNCEINDENAVTAATIIANNKFIKELHLSNCSIQESGLVQITNSIAKHLKNLVHIHFRLSNFKCSDKIAEHVKTLINSNKKLKHIHLCECQLSKLNFRNIIQEASKLYSLEHINLDMKHFTEKDFVATDLVSLIALNKRIVSLYLNISLNHNYLKVLLSAMKQSHSLMHVNLNTEELSSESTIITDIIHIVKNNHELKEMKVHVPKLVLKQNSMEKLGYYCGKLKFDDIHHLSIDGWTFDTKKWNILNKLIADNTTVDNLNLSDCNMFIKISEVVQSFVHLKYFNVNNVSMDASVSTYKTMNPSLTSLVSFTLNRINFTKQEELALDVASIVSKNNVTLNHFAMVKCNASRQLQPLCNILQQCNNIQHLDLSDTITDHNIAVSVLTNNMSLTHLNIALCKFDENETTEVCNILLGHCNIEQLNLSHNKHVGKCASKIATVIRNNKQLKHIEMSACDFNKGNSFEICEVIDLCPNLQHIDLSYNSIAVATFISSTKHLEHINLKKCGLMEGASMDIISNLATYNSLKYVDLSLNEMSEDSIIHVTEMITNNSKTIEELCLPDCNLNCTTTSNIIKSLQCASFLRHVDLGFAEIDVQSITILTDTINQNKTLKELRIFKLSLNQEGFKTLSESNYDTKIRGLKHLDITATAIGFINLDKLIVFLGENCQMITLNLTDCVIQFKGKIELFSKLESFKSLQSFNICGITIDGQLEEKLATLISKNVALKHLEVAKCQLSNSGIKKLLLALENHHKIYLNISGNSFTTENTILLVDLIKHTVIEELKSSNCNITNFSWVLTLLNLKELKYLDLSYNTVSVIDYEKELQSHDLKNDCLHFFSLFNCNLTSWCTHKLITQLTNFKSLRHLNLNSNTLEIHPAVVDDIVTVISNNKHISYFSLPNCFLSNDMIQHIFDAIQRVKSLNHIDFGSNQINNQLASNVAAAISSNSGLVQLRFSELVLTHSGFSQLSKSMLIMKGLKNISITGVHFTYDDACNLVTLINNNQSVILFDISDCVMSDKGKNIIFQAIVKLTSLKSLNLKNIEISDMVEDNLWKVIENNKNLEYLEVTENKINLQKLSEVLSQSNLNRLKLVY